MRLQKFNKTSDFWNSIYMKGPTQLLIQIFFIEGAMQEFPINFKDFNLVSLCIQVAVIVR